MTMKNLMIIFLVMFVSLQAFAQEKTASSELQASDLPTLTASYYLAIYSDNTYQVLQADAVRNMMTGKSKSTKIAEQLIALASVSKSASSSTTTQRLPFDAGRIASTGGTTAPKYCACIDDDPDEVCETRYVRCDTGTCQVCCGYASESIRINFYAFYEGLEGQGIMIKKK
jgi:hypothetical protein